MGKRFILHGGPARCIRQTSAWPPRIVLKIQGPAMPDRRYRVLAVATHPVQYMTPILRRMSKHPSLDFQVAYCSMRGAEASDDPEFGANIQWDVPLLDGYSWTHVPNRGSGAESFFGLFNPGLSKFIRSGNYDAVLCFIGYVRASFWVALLAAKLSKSAFLFGTDATTLAPRDGRAWKTALKKILWPSLFRLADQVIVPSSARVVLMRFLGFVNQSQLPAVYISADLFVIPSGYDPCPVVVCEAMLCGLPVVLSDQIRGRFDLVRPGETGDIFSCGDISALAASIQKLLSGSVALAEMKLNALHRMATWSPQQNIGATLEPVPVPFPRAPHGPPQDPAPALPSRPACA